MWLSTHTSYTEQPPSKECEVEWKLLSHVQLFATPWTVACQAPLSMEFSRPEYWSGLPFPSPGDLPNLRVEPRSPALQVDSLSSSHQGNPQPRIFSPKCQFCGVWASLRILSEDSVFVSLSHTCTHRIMQNTQAHTCIHTYPHLCPPRHLPGLC